MNNLCTCPQCQSAGSSLSSVVKSQTYRDSDGKVTQSQLAHLFQEPVATHHAQGDPIWIFICALASGASGFFFQYLAKQHVDNSMYFILDKIPAFWFILMIVLFIIFFIRINSPRQLSLGNIEVNRYQNLYYCQSCDVLYDSDRKTYPCNDNGYLAALHGEIK